MHRIYQRDLRLHGGSSVIAVPVVQVTAAVVIALFVLQVVRRLAGSSQNTVAQGLSDGIGFLTAP